MDPERVHDRVRGGARPRRTVGRPGRAPARPGCRTGRVHRRVVALRAGPGGGLAGGGEDGAGGRCRSDGAGVPVAAAGRRPAGTARPRARVLVGARRPGRGPRAGDRWWPGRDRLALGLLGEPAGGGRGDRARPAPGAREPRRGAGESTRPARRATSRAGGRPGCRGAGRGGGLGLGVGRLPGPVAGGRLVRGSGRGALVPASGAGAGARTVPVPDVRRGRSGVGGVLRGLRRLPPQHRRVPHHGLALHAPGGGAGHCAGAADGAAVRAPRRAPVDPRAGWGRAGRRPWLRGGRRRAAAVAGAPPDRAGLRDAPAAGAVARRGRGGVGHPLAAGGGKRRLAAGEPGHRQRDPEHGPAGRHRAGSGCARRGAHGCRPRSAHPLPARHRPDHRLLRRGRGRLCRRPDPAHPTAAAVAAALPDHRPQEAA